MSICSATLLLSQLVGPACVQTRSSNPRGRACGLSGKGSGEEGILSGVVPVYLYCPAFNVIVSLGVCLQACTPGLVQAYMPAGRPATQLASHRRPRPRLSGARRQGLQQPANMQPGTFCYR